MKSADSRYVETLILNHGVILCSQDVYIVYAAARLSMLSKLFFPESVSHGLGKCGSYAEGQVQSEFRGLEKDMKKVSLLINLLETKIHPVLVSVHQSAKVSPK
ncbi:hypothetical protein BaRGS_00020109 [Batillaria attramentaria]|uniref:Uncharacterized protein n=1 Tax=Batillaria attramentaria TaxID=370345 RepID=A0ABD0KNG0_9CAEN